METLPALSSATLWDILNEKLDDDTVNRLVWHHLGYRYDAASETWKTDAVEAAWAEKFPTPPNFIESRPATVDRKSTRLNSSHSQQTRMPSSA